MGHPITLHCHVVDVRDHFAHQGWLMRLEPLRDAHNFIHIFIFVAVEDYASIGCEVSLARCLTLLVLENLDLAVLIDYIEGFVGIEHGNF